MNRLSLPLCAFAAVLMGIAQAAVAAEVEVGTATSTLKFVAIYGGSDGGESPQFAGDIVADMNDPLDAGVCQGGWVAKADPQYDKIHQSLMAAKMLGSHVRIFADPGRLWAGSGGKYCYIHFVIVY